ncbi:S8 family serine peptidase [Antribacter sp. KLBMP9083]|uniref:S8 family serine peptidase n=1 Tax=Antribacter soli TaxID=2910976 RepID=A0AA41QBR9_9MICO|nr:S8 family serine peptidase [Antribacter soli]MCF4120323.1 S8 family serine peptidase [Antribacter soli]
MRTRAGAAAAIATAIVLGGGTWSAVAAPDTGQEPAPGHTATRTTATTATVTLLTGDRVTVTEQADGRTAVAVLRGPGREGIAFQQYTDGDHLYVVPLDVADLVPTRLDRALFDVTGLVAAGYDDASRSTLPVIVQSAGTPSGSVADGARAGGSGGKADWAAAGLSPDRTLESVGAVADGLPKGRATKLLAALEAPAAAGTAPAIDRVWLDAPVRSLDADSMPQIGAPEAWAAGYTGEGVTVAVLDTGIDATHPDLDDVVVGERDFTGKGSVVDGQGHGSHVASILAGSGDASDGVNQGVAPDAGLLVGKVLDDGGSGEMSWVIEGMEWAASSGADIVSMSLGASEYTDGTDPAARAVDALSAEYGTLFVIAAGNASEHGTIGTPGSASSALTVGAVDDADQVTDFSSRGPRAGDHAIKPDVTAPGDGIVAARAAGTTLGDVVDDSYVAASGTSMATPHVAGAAAVLRQARPELTGPELKAVLMGSAQPTGGTVWDEGAGRILLPSALAHQVTTNPASLSLGAFTFPHESVSAGTVTYTNPTADDVTLALSIDVTDQEGAPLEGAVTLSADSVTIPAGGTATVDVTVDQGPGALGRYSGALVATGADGSTVRTAVGWYKEPELFDLTLRATGRDGQPHTGVSLATVMNADDAGAYGEFLFLEGSETTVRVPAGTYSVAGYLLTEGEELGLTEATAALEPELTVTDDTTVELDARQALPVSVTTPRRTDQLAVSLTDQRGDTLGNSVGSTIMLEGELPVFVTPTEPVTTGTFSFVNQFTLAEPVGAGEVPSYTYDLLFHQETAMQRTRFRADASNTAVATVRYSAPGPEAQLDTVRPGWAPGHFFAIALGYPVEPGTERTEYLSTGGVLWGHDVAVMDDVDLQGFLVGETVVPLPRERLAERFGGAVLSTRLGTGGVVVQAGSTLFAGMSAWSDGGGNGWLGFEPETRLDVWQDGEHVGESAEGYVELAVPDGGAHYRLAVAGERETPWWALSTGVSTEWEFTAAPVAEEEFSYLPLLDVAYEIEDLTLDSTAPRNAEVTLRVSHQTDPASDGAAGAAVEGARLWWSADDGATWHAAAVSATGDGTYTAKVAAPKGTSHVSLKVEARDAAGSTIKQTVVRAYKVG